METTKSYTRYIQRMYGEYASSYDEKTPLEGECFIVADDEDEDGYNWRIFIPEHWALVEHLSDQEIYAKYPGAPYRFDKGE